MTRNGDVSISYNLPNIIVVFWHGRSRRFPPDYHWHNTAIITENNREG